MSTLKDDITQQASKGFQILWSDPFLSKIYELPVNEFNWIFIEINGSCSWWNRLYLNFVFIVYSCFPLSYISMLHAGEATSKMDGEISSMESRKDSPHQPSQNGKILTMTDYLLSPTHHCSGFLKAHFHAQPWGLRAESPQTYSLCSDLYHPCICSVIPGKFLNNSLCLSFLT